MTSFLVVLLCIVFLTVVRSVNTSNFCVFVIVGWCWVGLTSLTCGVSIFVVYVYRKYRSQLQEPDTSHSSQVSVFIMYVYRKYRSQLQEPDTSHSSQVSVFIRYVYRKYRSQLQEPHISLLTGQCIHHVCVQEVQISATGANTSHSSQVSAASKGR